MLLLYILRTDITFNFSFLSFSCLEVFMRFYISSFEVRLTQFRDYHFEFELIAFYCSDEMVDGQYLRNRLLLMCEPYRIDKNNFSRIMKLCVPFRISEVKPCYELLEFTTSVRPIPVSTVVYRFVYADGIASMKRALESYGIVYDYETLVAELPF